jgi:ribosomal protein S27E
MTYGGGPFGRAFHLHTELVNGKCPTCHENSILVGVEEYTYRCTTCGTELKQKVNGVISYIPSVASGGKIPKLDVITDADG